MGRRRRGGARGPTGEDECFKCGEKGHWANECREQGRGGDRGGDRERGRRDSRDRGDHGMDSRRR